MFKSDAEIDDARMLEKIKELLKISFELLKKYYDFCLFSLFSLFSLFFDQI